MTTIESKAAPLPCKLCGKPGAIEHVPDHVHAWKAYCPDFKSPDHRGINGQSLTAKTENACVRFWNRRQLGEASGFREHVTAVREARHHREVCPKCFLTEPHECLMGEGFARLSDRGEASARVRMAY